MSDGQLILGHYSIETMGICPGKNFSHTNSLQNLYIWHFAKKNVRFVLNSSISWYLMFSTHKAVTKKDCFWFFFLIIEITTFTDRQILLSPQIFLFLFICENTSNEWYSYSQCISSWTKNKWVELDKIQNRKCRK